MGVEEWFGDILVAGATGTLVVFAIRKALYSWVLEPLANKFDKSSESDSKDKVGTLWATC